VPIGPYIGRKTSGAIAARLPRPLIATQVIIAPVAGEWAIPGIWPERFVYRAAKACAYLPAVASCDATLEKVVFNCEPSVFTTVMIATEIPAAINPYSMEVAPDSSSANRLARLIMQCSRFLVDAFRCPVTLTLCDAGQSSFPSR
jgi:hypothetical protein